jgi:hypothetical protein
VRVAARRLRRHEFDCFGRLTLVFCLYFFVLNAKSCLQLTNQCDEHLVLLTDLLLAPILAMVSATEADEPTSPGSGGGGAPPTAPQVSRGGGLLIPSASTTSLTSLAAATATNRLGGLPLYVAKQETMCFNAPYFTVAASWTLSRGLQVALHQWRCGRCRGLMSCRPCASGTR